MELWIKIALIFAVVIGLIAWTVILARRECEKGWKKRKNES